MSSVYIVGEGSETTPLERIHCRDEERELQLMLERNPDLLPGDQINPESPRRWLVIQREMSVPDPATGHERWSIDLLLADQDGTPTFVECKRYQDTRARREVVGQMIEYAANGHYYWSREELQQLASASAKAAGESIEERLKMLGVDNSADEYFEKVEENLREAQLRIVFFMEESPFELRSIVDFLNRQMERSEVLLVEARQYRKDGLTVVAPMLFGYTESARQVKRTVNVSRPGSVKKWDYDSFMAHVASDSEPAVLAAIKQVYDAGEEIGFLVSWGRGYVTGSFGFMHHDISPRTFLSVYSNGALTFNFGWLDGEEIRPDAKKMLAEHVLMPLGLEVPEGYDSKFPSYRAEEWVGQVDLVISGLKDFAACYKN